MKIDLRFTQFPYVMWGLQNYLKALEESVNYHQQQYPIRIKSELKKKGYKCDDPEVDSASQEINAMVEHIFPRTFRNSFIVALWAVFESLIEKPDSVPEAKTEAIVNYLSKRNKMKLKSSDFSGGFIKKIKKYFTYVSEVTGVNLNLSQEKWRKIEMLYVLRNAIVHGGGIMDNLKPDIKNKLREWGKQPGKFEIIWGEIVLTKESLEESYSLVNEIGLELIEKVKSSF